MNVYDRSLDHIQTIYHFSDTEIAHMDYTLKVVFYEVSKMLFYTLFFLAVGKIEEFAVCIAALLPLRWFSGGLHLKHFFTCFLFSFFFFSVIVFGLGNCQLPYLWQVVLLTACNICLYVIGPVTSAKRKTMKKKQYDCMRFLASVFLLFYSIFYFVLENVPHRTIIFWSIILQVIQLYCAKKVRKGEVYEKV